MNDSCSSCGKLLELEEQLLTYKVCDCSESVYKSRTYPSKQEQVRELRKIQLQTVSRMVLQLNETKNNYKKEELDQALEQLAVKFFNYSKKLLEDLSPSVEELVLIMDSEIGKNIQIEKKLTLVKE
jgi:hypothetical protein